MDSMIQALSHIHWTQQNSRNPADEHNDLLLGRSGRRYFQELYFRRRGGEVWKSKNEIQQTFHYQKKRDPRNCKVQYEETRTWCASRYIHHRPIRFVWALRIWSPSRWINLRSYHVGVAVEVGHIKNQNKNPVVETCVAELGDELLCICPQVGRISPLSFLLRQTVRISWVCKLAKDWEFKHVTSSPLYAKTNGEAGRAVQTAKNLLQKEDDSAKALLAYQSIPLQGGKSPSELLFGGQIRCTVPCITTYVQPGWPGIGDWKQEKSRRKMKQKLYYDTWRRVNELHQVQPGERVWVQKENKQATVLDGDISNQEVEQQSQRESIAQGVQLCAPDLAGQQDPQETWTVDFKDLTLISLRRLY